MPCYSIRPGHIHTALTGSGTWTQASFALGLYRLIEVVTSMGLPWYIVGYILASYISTFRASPSCTGNVVDSPCPLYNLRRRWANLVAWTIFNEFTPLSIEKCSHALQKQLSFSHLQIYGRRLASQAFLIYLEIYYFRRFTLHIYILICHFTKSFSPGRH